VCGQQEQAQWSGTTQVRDNVMGYVSLNVDRQVTCDVGTMKVTKWQKMTLK